MSDALLFVDDESNVLDGIRRQLRNRYTLFTANSPEEGLTELASHPEIAVVVSDMRMPSMNGAQFLAHVRALRPDTIRLILSGQSDVDAAIAAVNNGNIFRFLTKPCAPEDLSRCLADALQQHGLVRAERELLEQTLAGAVDLLVEVLALSNPTLLARSFRIQSYAMSLAKAVGEPEQWELKMAAVLCQIGCLSIRSETLAKAAAGQQLSKEEAEVMRTHPEVAEGLVARIPRLSGVAHLIGGLVRPTSADKTRPQTAQERRLVDILRAAVAFDDHIARGRKPAEAVKLVEQGQQGLLPELVRALPSLHVEKGGDELRSIGAAELEQGMVFEEDVYSGDGVLLTAKGKVVTETVILLLRNYARTRGIREPFTVRAKAGHGTVDVAAARVELSSLARAGRAN